MAEAPLGPNASLIGQPGSRDRLQTPALVLDLDGFERNVADMARHCEKNEIGLRPHTKTHKSVAIARAQMAAGAVGVCCAKLGEAEVMAAGGLESILITSPVVTPGAIERLVALDARAPKLLCVVDHAGVAEELARAARRAGRVLGLLVDLNVGTFRTGLRVGSEAYALAEQIAESPDLELCGLQAYAGHLMHIESYEERREKSLAAMAEMLRARDEIEKRGHPIGIMTGGGTGTYDIDPQAGVLSDLQGGSYVFMDVEYNAVPTESGPIPFETTLWVQTTVISANNRGLCTTDAGFKSFATDGPKPQIRSGAPEGSSYIFMGDEHGGVLFGDKEQRLEVGSVLRCTTPHCDPTVNLYDVYHCVRGDTLVDIWPIDARGRSA
jgi:3-hydroxy-D-aspartate aldolase